MVTDPYRVLGITGDASDEAVKKAYRSMCKKYHPDVNPGNPAAEERFKEIQTAHDQILRQRRGEAEPAAGAQTWGYSGPYRQTGGAYDPFGGFGFGGAYGNAGSGADARDESNEMRAACNYINARHFREALNVLASVKDRTSKWHYYSALANAGIGVASTARVHAQQAVNMEPNNFTYILLLRQLSGQQQYAGTVRRYTLFPGFSFSKFLLVYLLIQFVLSLVSYR